MSMYLLAKYLLRPRESHRTAQKGYWQQEGAGQLDEQLSFSRKVRNSDLQSCNVILDLSKKKIVKCVVGDLQGSDYNRVFDYFKTNYPEHIAVAMREVEGLPAIGEQVGTVTHAPEVHSPEIHAAPNGEIHVQPAPATTRRRRTQSK